MSHPIFCPMLTDDLDTDTESKAISKNRTTSGQRAVFMVNLLWPIDFIINIYFMNSGDPRLEWMNVSRVPSDFLDPLYAQLQHKVDPVTLVKRIIKDRFQPLVRLNFNFVEDVNKSHVRVLFDSTSGSSWSRVGYSISPILTKPTMVFNRLDVATVIHEVCHMLGMSHEHQNPKNNPIQWNREAVFCYYKQLNFDPVNLNNWSNSDIEKNVLERLNANITNGSEYDPASIMVYSFEKSVNCNPQSFICGCNCNRQKKTCVCPDDNPQTPSQCNTDNFTCTCATPPKQMDLTMNGMFVRPNFRLSPTDIFWLENAYPKNGVRRLDMIPTKAIPAPVYNEFANTDVATWYEIRIFFEKNYVYLILCVLILVFLLFLIKFHRKHKATAIARKSKKNRGSTSATPIAKTPQH